MPKRVGPYWTDARFTLEVHEPGAAGPRLVPFGRPFALIGRITHADLHLDDRDVSARHVYLHADVRGLFAVDLATRTGTRFGEAEAPCGWLRPGESIEVAGRLIRVASFELDGRAATPPPCAVNLLTDAGDVPLAGLTLEPVAGRGPSWALGSELAFVGRGDGCAIRLNQANVSRTHCALLRTAHAAYVIDLPGQPTLVNGQPPRGATAPARRRRPVDRPGPLRGPARRPTRPRRRAARAIARIRAAPVGPRSGPVRRSDRYRARRPARPRRPPVPDRPDPARVPRRGPRLDARDAPRRPVRAAPPPGRAPAVGRGGSPAPPVRRRGAARVAGGADRPARRGATPARGPTPAARATGRPAAPEPLARGPRSAPTPAAARDVPPAPEINPARSLATAAWLLERIDKLGNENKTNIKSFFSRIGTSIRKAEEAASTSTQSPATGADRPDAARGPRKASEGPDR